jgi:hypothetical protein
VAGEAVVHTTDPLERGRQSYARRAWKDAYESLIKSDQGAPLGAADLELLATTAYMLGRDDAYVTTSERAHHAYLRAGAPLRAVRCAFWLGVSFCSPRRDGAGDWMARSRTAAGRTRGG